MTTVTVAEARENLSELLRRAAAGEQIVITDAGMSLAALGKAPPLPPTADEIAAQLARAEANVQEYSAPHAEIPPQIDRETVQHWLDEHRR